MQIFLCKYFSNSFFLNCTSIIKYAYVLPYSNKSYFFLNQFKQKLYKHIENSIKHFTQIDHSRIELLTGLNIDTMLRSF